MDKLTDYNIAHELFTNYYTYWNTSVSRKGYSGVSIITKYEPLRVKYGIGIPEHDEEGRVITLDYPNFYLVSVYVPNAGDYLKRLEYRVNVWDRCFFNYLNSLRKRKDVIIAGDMNVAHQNIDVYDYVGKDKQAGFTYEERKSFDSFLKSGFIDTFRLKYPKTVIWVINK
jgi:exodeoxyribonuclease-3